MSVEKKPCRPESKQIEKTPPNPPSRKEIKRQLQSGKLTKEQAIELFRQYMDSLEYTSRS